MSVINREKLGYIEILKAFFLPRKKNGNHFLLDPARAISLSFAQKLSKHLFLFDPTPRQTELLQPHQVSKALPTQTHPHQNPNPKTPFHSRALILSLVFLSSLSRATTILGHPHLALPPLPTPSVSFHKVRFVFKYNLLFI
uniref:Uncharacterized protein n=1 Tax=Cannabis sativa TaxID=3483 RepID=A0A803R7N3_CANSA